MNAAHDPHMDDDRTTVRHLVMVVGVLVGVALSLIVVVAAIT
ncbi:MAG TPA: hypothetical protein VLA56_07745 [Pseudomonadales bacterium]|nr:hypothetical protein [Pseudomonadales bacterium]